MIWVWIIAAIAISWLLCRKKVAWYHYIWMLLPVEMYGITIAGATIKPYMILGVFMIIKNLLDRSNNIPFVGKRHPKWTDYSVHNAACHVSGDYLYCI